MATYPSYVQIAPTRDIPEDGIVVDRADSGRPRFRSFYPATQVSFEVVHEVESAEKEAIKAFFQANKLVPFTFTYEGDNQTYNCRFAGNPECSPTMPGYWRVTCRLIVV